VSHREKGKYLKNDLEKMKQGLTTLEAELMQTALTLPNLTHPDVPLTEPKLLEKRNDRQPESWFWDHLELGKLHDLFDFDTASDITGSKFVILKNQAVLLEQALVNWSLQHIYSKGYRLMAPPDICRQEILAGCGFRPRDPAGQVYNLEGGKLSLIATAEIPLAGIHGIAA
jgi:seryl-tRNA synthetase